MTYLGLDYGTAHIGVALSAGPLAEPLTTLSASSFISHIPNLISQHCIDAIVVGQTSPEFLTQLKSFGLPVYQEDETLSSHDARISLFHTSPTRRKNMEHAASAALILQSYLDSHHQA